MSSDPLSIKVSYGDANVEFSGSPEVVMRSLHEFVSKVIPGMDLARAISLNHSLNDMTQMFRDYVKITPEGPRVWTQDKRLSDRDTILLQLVATRMASLSGRSASDAMSIGEIEAATGLYPKTISSRLSELAKSALVERLSAEAGGRYRITTIGVSRLGEQLAKKLKTAGP